MEPLRNLIVRRGFDRFQPGLRARLGAYRLKYNLTYCEPTENPALRIDLESPQQLVRLTAWASGACDIEVIHAQTGEIALSEHHDLRHEDEFHPVLAHLVTFMRKVALPSL